MIKIKTKHFEHKYPGNIYIAFREDIVFIESHYSGPTMNDEDTLNTWQSDTYDWFWTEDIISITGEE